MTLLNSSHLVSTRPHGISSCTTQWKSFYSSTAFLCVAHSLRNSKQASALPIANMDRRTTERSTSDSLGDISWVQKATLKLYRRNVLCAFNASWRVSSTKRQKMNYLKSLHLVPIRSSYVCDHATPADADFSITLKCLTSEKKSIDKLCPTALW